MSTKIKRIKNVVCRRTMLPLIYCSSSTNNIISAALPPDVPDSYVSLNELNASSPGRYLFPKIMGKDKNGTDAGEMGLAI